MTSGAPSEAEVQAQWRNTVDLLDKTEVYSDSLLGASQEFETLISSLKGDFTPGSLASWADNFRAGLSSLADPTFVFQAIAPCLLEYGKVLQAGGYTGSGFETPETIIAAIYERFITATLQFVESRAITFDLSGTTSGTGSGEISRLTTDENGFDIENTAVEAKRFRCLRDQNSGTREFAEEFVMLGETRSKDHLETKTTGTGDTQRRIIFNRHAGTSSSGSIARNGSFDAYDAAATNDFTFWELVSGTVPTQNTADAYQSFPGNTAIHSLQAGAAFRLKQSLLNLRRSKLDPNRPYFLRVMVKQNSGTPDGNVILHMGSQSVTVAASVINATTNWYELFLPIDENSWFKNFNQDDFNIEIEATLTTGTLIFDDLIFGSFDQIDGTWWIIRQNAVLTLTSWLKDAEVLFSDTQADITKGKIQYYLYRAGLGYLPSSTGTPTITFPDP